jgi:hypothetical protein
LLVLCSCSVYLADAYLDPKAKKRVGEWEVRPYVQADMPAKAYPDKYNGRYNVLVEAKPRGADAGEPPSVDSVSLAVGGTHLTLQPLIGPPTQVKRTVFYNFGGAHLPPDGESLRVRLFGPESSDDYTRTVAVPDEMVLKRFREKYIGFSEPPEGTDLISHSTGIHWGVSCRASGRMQVYDLIGLNAIYHWGSDKWATRVHFSFLEVWHTDSTNYFTSLLLVPMTAYTSVGNCLGAMASGWLAPDFEIERSLNSARSLKLFAGTDLLLGLGNIGSQSDFHRGLLVSPKFGVQLPLGLIKVRLHVSSNHWWRFDVRNRDLGLTFGFDILTGREFAPEW